MHQEWKNIFSSCVDPRIFLRTVWFFVTRVFYSLQYRYRPPSTYYPKNVRTAWKQVRTRGKRASHDDAPGERPRPPLRRGRLQLAVGFFAYHDIPDWKKSFDDAEQTMSLHRWGWLLYDGDAMDAGRGRDVMRSWLAAMGTSPKGVAGTPYTTGERIVNALLFFRRKNISLPSDLQYALHTMALRLADVIEYHGVRGTGNHVVNNARALFFAGQMLDVPELSALASAVLSDALPQLITRDGFLREESSHYHLLFTRWLIEVYVLAQETNHKEMEDFLEPWVKRCAERCWFFLVQEQKTQQWHIPLIGDVSPDCTPEWLVTHLVPKIEQFAPRSFAQEGMQAFSESGWFRLDRGLLTMFWHIPQEQMVHRATHGHSDLGSFVLLRKGVPVLIDRGRSTYDATDPSYIWSGSARAHNTLCIDGFNPVPYDRAQKLPPWYHKRRVDCAWSEEGDACIVTLSHNGFRRLKKGLIDHTRRFRISVDAVEIDDALRGVGTHTVETFFHWDPAIRDPLFHHSHGHRADVLDWTSPRYGDTIPSHTYVIQHRAAFPVLMKSRVEFSRLNV